MEPYGFFLPFQICSTSPPPVQIEIELSGVVVDSNGNSFGMSYTYVYDNSVPQSENVANIKAGIVKEAAAQAGVTLTTNNVTLIMAVN